MDKTDPEIQRAKEEAKAFDLKLKSLLTEDDERKLKRKGVSLNNERKLSDRLPFRKITI